MDEKGKELFESLGSPLLKDLEGVGLTRKKLVENLKEQLSATEVKAFNANGRIIYSDPLPAWETRQRALVIALKLCDFYPKETIEVDQGLSVEVISFKHSQEAIPKTEEEAQLKNPEVKENPKIELLRKAND